MRNILIFIFIFFIVSCGEDVESTVNETVEKGEYTLVIVHDIGSESVMLDGDTVDTNWDRTKGLIYLGTDENNEPLGTLTMTIGNPDSENFSDVITAILSTTDVKIGTGPEINGKLYNLISGEISNVEIGKNYVSASIGMSMERVIVHTGDEPETVSVIGTFTAKSK